MFTILWEPQSSYLVRYHIHLADVGVITSNEKYKSISCKENGENIPYLQDQH